MLDAIQAVRQNHALEHATIHVLSRRCPTVALVGRTTPSGFVLYGQVDTAAVADAAAEALLRLATGERHLAVHPRCGTNLVVVGMVAGLAGFVGGWGPSRSRLERLPLALSAAIVGAVVGQPLARLVQQHVTTSASVEGVTIDSVSRQEMGRLVAHHIVLRRA